MLARHEGWQGAAEMAQAEMNTLEAKLGYTFARRDLLDLALTHSSLAYERGPQTGEAQDAGTSGAAPGADNEQLEFLGDAALGLLVAEGLYRRYPALQEGDLTRLRAGLVSRKHLGEVGTRLDLGKYLRLGRGEERSGGRRKAALLANAMEAVFAAVYLDGGLEALRSVVDALVMQPSLPELESALSEGKAMGDHKSALQEYLQATGAGQPKYVVMEETGPDHRKRFSVEVRLQRPVSGHLDQSNGLQGVSSGVSSGASNGNAPERGDARNGGGWSALARAEGATKKQAQQEAARLAYERLTQEKVADGSVPAARAKEPANNREPRN